MALLGILSFIQIALLPGALLLSSFGYRGSLLRRILLSFGLSLTANYLAVFALTTAHLYTRSVVLGSFGAELIALAWLNKTAIQRWLFTPLPSGVWKRAVERIHRRLTTLMHTVAERQIVPAVLLLAALVQIVWELAAFTDNLGTVFMGYDAVVSWNRWALDWFQNELPYWTWHYPQLLTANWSISYVFMNTPLQYVSKGMMPLFMLALMVAMADLGWTTKTPGFYIAPLIAGFLYPRCQILIAEGNADIAVSSMAFLSLFCMIAARGETEERTSNQYLAIGAVLAAASAATKQAGLYFLPIYPLLAFTFVLAERTGPNLVRALRLAAVYLVIVLVVTGPFYAYAQMRIQAGLHTSEIAYTTQGIFRGTPIPQRLVNAQQLLITGLGQGPILLIASLGLLAAIRDRLSRWILALIVVPYGLLWASLFSYDLRNLALALPFLAMCVGSGAGVIVRGVTVSPDSKRAWPRLAIFAGLVVLLAVSVFHFLPTDQLVAHHRRLEREIGNAALNAKLYEHQAKHAFSGKIVTNYGMMTYLPGLGEYYVLQNVDQSSGSAEPTEFEQYLRNIRDPKVGYLLLPDNTYRSIMSDVETRIASNAMKLLFHAEGYWFVEIVSR